MFDDGIFSRINIDSLYFQSLLLLLIICLNFCLGLSTFTGLLCKKYQFDLSGILQYVLNQLKVGKR